MARSKPGQWSSLVFGLLVVAAGVLLLLDRAERIDSDTFFRWWPLALVAIGAGYLAEKKWIAGAIWAGVGTVLIFPRLGIEGVDLWTLIGIWPLMISAAGVALIGQALRPARKDVLNVPGAALRAAAWMAGNIPTINAREFLGGDAVALMGGCEIDLTAARPGGSEMVIDVLAFWGAIELRVPENWTVVNKVTPILASYEDKTRPGPEGGPRLILRGSAIMGGIEVRN